ncbi:hypothetical protein TNCV_2458151 [Trichonephila clavipes]|nr:hypothetical protein TNCV_2458151 [Trichonephila clavipes]
MPQMGEICGERADLGNGQAPSESSFKGIRNAAVQAVHSAPGNILLSMRILNYVAVEVKHGVKYDLPEPISFIFAWQLLYSERCEYQHIQFSQTAVVESIIF